MTKIIFGNHCTTFRTPLINHISYEYKLQKSLAQWLKQKTIPRQFYTQMYSEVGQDRLCHQSFFIILRMYLLTSSLQENCYTLKKTTASMFSEECRKTKCSSLGKVLFSQFPPQDSLATSQQPELCPIAIPICDRAWEINNFSRVY